MLFAAHDSPPAEQPDLGRSAHDRRHERMRTTCDDDCVPRWITSYWDEEDTTFVWEVGDDGRVTRHIELVGLDQRPQAASALDEWMRELAAGRIQTYQERYGALADQPITDWDFPHSDITDTEFERLWATARRAMESKA